MTSTERHTTRFKKMFHFLITTSIRGARYVYATLLLPKSRNEDDKRRERILTIILFSIAIFLLLLESAVLSEWFELRSSYSGINIFLFTGVTISCIYLFYLCRIGYYKFSSYLFIIIYFSLTIYGSIHFGASMPAGLLSYVLVITMASIVIGTYAGTVTTIASIGGLLFIGLDEHAKGIIHHWRLLPIKINDLIQYSVFFLLIAVVSWLSNSEMEKSLKRARKSEQLLKEERDNLEVLVETRTKALREAEHERIVQLHRFADFGKRSAGLFHDLLGPLGALTLTVGGLKHSEQSEDVSIAINNAIDATHRMQQFMGTIRKQLAEEETIISFSPMQQTEEAIHLLHYQALQSRVTITLSGDAAIAITGNPFKFTQIITNLIANAIEAYTGVSIEERIVSIAISADLGQCLITVTDQGVGIPHHVQAKIFDTFFTTKQSGIGLGLATVKDIVEKAFHGSIACESSSMTTCFRISLPLNDSTTNSNNP